MLRDRYEMLRSINPYIPEARFRWEQVGSWVFDIKLREYPDLLSGGKTGQFNPAWLYGTEKFFRYPYACLKVALVTVVLELVYISGIKRMVIGFVAESDSRRLWPIIVLLKFLIVVNRSPAVFD
jgi:hypothetical protein